ncbi:hypothetical protein BV20DRAFT_779626 [Pilatotrama ljubarskyi]|nr:hypothetical protein BV20DRAFT_779626 [Pilatotrama ljubarskyi]
MACTPTPTLTEYELLTTSSVTTTTSDSLTTIPPDVTTTLSSSCVLSSVNVLNHTTICLSSTTVEVVSTIDATSGSVVSFVLTIPITESQPTKTLFSPCSTDGDGGSSQPPSPPPPPPPSSQVTFPSGPVVVSISTPPPTVIVSEVSSTLADGSVFVTYMTYTSTLPPTPVFLPTSLTGDGGVLGGFFGLIGLVALIWFIWRKRESLRDRYGGQSFPEYEPTLASSRPRRAKGSSPPPGLEPKPYQYGLVGRPPSTPSHCSSPGTSPPPTRPQSFSALSAMTAYTPPIAPQNSSTPNLLRTTSPVAPARPITPMTPLTPMSFGQHRPSGSEASVGTAVSYPFPVLPPTPHDDNGRASTGEDESVSERRPTRLSLTLANWNPETDGELFPRASSDDGRPGSVRQRGEEGRSE